MVKEVDPSDIGKFPHLIKKAQIEMSKTDVHVCGHCHGVFHFVELFLKHRQHGCSEESALRESKETKPKVWAFLLWKASQLGNEQGNGNAWKQYQNWIKLEDTVRETWIVAGRTIQSFAKMGQGNLHEMPVKITKTVVDTTVDGDSLKNASGKQGNLMNSGNIRNVSAKGSDGGFDSLKNDQSKMIKKSPLTRSPLAKIPSNPVLLNKGISKLATRTIPNTNETETEERIIEKILAKRYNPRKKEHEYLVKWENSSHEDNTWEPSTNLKNCSQLLDTFEKQLARQKEQRALMAARQAALQVEQEKAEAAAAAGNSPGADSPSTGRPVRNSKARAMDNVRQWCAENDEITSGGGKRKSDDSDYDQDHETEEDERQTPPAKFQKTENNVAVAQALLKAGQSGNVRIVPVGKTTNSGGGTIIPKENGTPIKSPDRNSADIVITSPRDGKQTGIVKKPGVVIAAVKTKNEAQVRVVQKGENTSSGVVRITSVTATQPSAAGKVAAKSVSNNVTTLNKSIVNQTTITPKSGVVPKPMITTRPASGTRVVSSVHNRQPLAQKQLQGRQNSVQQIRSSLSPASSPNTSIPPKSGITRIVKKSPVGVGPQTMSHDEKLAALTRHGDLKITRKQVSHVPQIASIKQRVIDDDDYNVSDPFPSTPITPAPPSPPRELTLCPVTGKVLSQAEGEPTPQPSPEPELELDDDIKFQLKKDQQEIDTDSGETQIHQILTNEDGTPVIVTGEDGTIYQVAGKNEQGQTVLIAQGADGEQQFVYVASEDDDGSLMTLDTAVAEAVQQGGVEQIAAVDNVGVEQQQYIMKQDVADDDGTQPLTVATDSDSQDGQITAEVIQADLPSPGGTRKVVLLLPDGNFVMTEVSDEQFQSLNLT